MKLNIVYKDWLNSRKISDKIIEDFNLHSDGDRLVIPITNQHGVFLFNKYRRSPLDEKSPKYTYDKGGKLALLGFHECLDKKTVLWLEGELDALVAWSLNIPAVSGTGGALSVSQDWKQFFAEREVVICFDNDNAGGEGMVKALELAPHAKLMFLPDRPGIKDISDYVQNGGDLHALIKTARHFSSIEEILEDQAKRASVWQSTYFHDAYARRQEDYRKVAPTRERDPAIKDKLTRAKAFPIDSMLKFNHSGSTTCLWHSESEPSLHLYKDQNKCWCFGGCGRGYDAIDVYQKLHNCSFIEAVEALQ